MALSRAAGAVVPVLAVLAWVSRAPYYLTDWTGAAGSRVSTTTPSTAGWTVTLALVALFALNAWSLKGGAKYKSPADEPGYEDLTAPAYAAHLYGVFRPVAWAATACGAGILVVNAWDLVFVHKGPRWAWTIGGLALLVAARPVTGWLRKLSGPFAQVPFRVLSRRPSFGLGQGLRAGSSASAWFILGWFLAALLPGVRPTGAIWPAMGASQRLAVALVDTQPIASLGLLVVPIAALGATRALGIRLSIALARERVEDPAIAPVLYLRSFDEDPGRVLRVATRQTPIEAMLPPRRVRFSESLARVAGVVAPVDAISAPHDRRSLAGASLLHFTDEEWRKGVREAAARSLFVLVSASPRSVREGLTWEIEHVGRGIGHARIVLVIGPWPADEVGDRWRRFVEEAQRYPAFASLAGRELPSGTCVLARASGTDWKVFGADMRTDAAYSLCLRSAFVEMVEEWQAELGIDLDRASTRAQLTLTQATGSSVLFGLGVSLLIRLGFFK